jgi:hypothetical protein
VPDGRVPVRALVARHAFDGAVWQAWGTVRSGRSKRWLLQVLNPRLVPMRQQANDWVIAPCFTSSAPFCPLYTNRLLQSQTGDRVRRWTASSRLAA